MDLVAYLRVSTVGQVEDGAGLDVQAEQCQRFADTHGYVIVATSADEGLSGALDVERRPKLADALSLVRHGEAEGLIVAKLDRLARSLTVQEGTLALVWRYGGKVFATDLGEVLADDPDDPMRTAMRQMAGVFAQLERATIRSRMVAGRRHKRDRGGYIGGQVPYGFRLVGDVLEPEEREQEALVLLGDLRGRGMSLRAIAAALDVEGYRPRQAERWSAESVRRIVARL